MKFTVFILGILLSSCYVSEVLPEDQAVWSYGQPETLGFDESRLLRLDSQITNMEYREVNSLLIIKEDHILFENYYDGSFRDRLRPIDIATFGYTVAFMDFFIQRGLIGSLDEPIYTFLPEYEAIFEATPDKKLITFRHLLIHASGLVWNQSLYSSYLQDSDFTEMKTTSNDWTSFILSKQLSPAPGLQTALNSGVGIILCKIYQNLLGEENLLDFFKENYFTPLGITNFTWSTDPHGTLDGATGLSLSSFDHAKFAMVIAKGGRATNKTRVLSEEWVFEMTRTQKTYVAEYDFGYGLRILKNGNIPILNFNGFVNLNGELGQHLYIDPSEELIIAIGAENYGQDYFYNNSLFLFIEILSARTLSPGN